MARRLYDFGPYRLDPAKRRLLRDGIPVPLTSKVFDTLLVLVESYGQSLTRQELVTRIWPDTSVGEHNLNQCVAVLRKMLDDDPRQPDYIATLPGRGYSFVAEVRISTNGNGERVNFNVDDPTNGMPTSEVPACEVLSPAASPGLNKVHVRWRYGIALVLLLLICAAIALPLRRGSGSSRHSGPIPRSLTVAPFDDFSGSGNGEKAYLAAGLSQELTAELSRLRELRVIVGRGPCSASAGGCDPRAIGRSLGVESVLQGSVRRWGQQYRIAVQLIDARDGRELWSSVFTGDATDFPGIEEDVVRHSADALRIPWTASLDQQRARHHTEDPRAHDLYLQGRYEWSQRTPTSMPRSLELMQRAIAIDPSFARAYAGLADCYAVMAVNGNLPVATAVPLARSAAAKALELDPTLAEPHAALGLLKFEIDWDFPGAQEEFRLSLALNPGWPTTRHWAGLNLTAMGQFEAAEEELRKAQELDPLSPMISEGLFENYMLWHRYDDGIAVIKALQARNPSEYGRFSFAIGQAEVAKHQYAEAEAVFRQLEQAHPEEDPNQIRLAQVLALEGKTSEARARLAAVERKPNPGAAPEMLAKVHLALGEKEIAIEDLQREYQMHGSSCTVLRDDPDFDGLRSDPRFQQIVRSVFARNEIADSMSLWPHPEPHSK